MPTFEITAPDGIKYHVEGPDGATEQDALAQVQRAHPAAQGANIGENRASAVSALRGIPILGAYTDKAAAALNAGLQPIIGSPGMSQAPTYSERYNENLPRITSGGNEFEQQHPIASTLGQVATGVGALAPVGATVLGARALGLGGTTAMGMAARGAASGAALGGADTAARGGDIGTGAAIGGLVGAAVPVAGRAIGAAISPFTMPAARQGAVNALENEGVQLTAGQRTGSRPLQWFEQSLGDLPGSGRGAANVAERQAEQFTAATLSRAGENANRATPDVIDRAFTRIGNQFDALAGRNTMHPDAQFGHDIQAALADYHGLVSPPNRAPVIQDFLSEMGTAIQRNGGNLPGDTFQSLTSRIERAARAARSAPEVADTLRDLRAALNDAMERSLVRSGNRADLGAWREVRNQYRNMLVIEKAATGAGENAALGLISPSQLRNATVNQNRRAYARGNGDFAELARSGEAVMKQLPQSGTAPRSYAQHLPGMIGATVGGIAGGIPGAALGGMAAIAGPPLLGRALMSRPMQAYLSNQLAAQLPIGGILGFGSRALLPSLNESRLAR